MRNTGLEFQLTINLVFFNLLPCSADQEKSPLPAEVTWEMKRPGSPAISHDGRWIADPVTSYSVTELSHTFKGHHFITG